MAKVRKGYIDAAKGISICLVVLWHTIGNLVYINELLIFLRLPLFFFTAGLFATRTLSMDWEPFLVKKVGNILWLFIIWTFIVYYSTVFVLQVLNGGPLDPYKPFYLFIKPPQTLWFMYALAAVYVFVRMTRVLPWWLTLSGAVFIYCASASYSGFTGISFPERVLRLIPFFLLAIRFAPEIQGFFEKHHRYWPLALITYFALAYFIKAQVPDSFEVLSLIMGPLAITAGLVGIFATFGMTYALSNFSLMKLLEWIGSRSLFVYVMHRIPLFYATEALKVFGIEMTPMIGLLIWAFAVGSTALVGEYVIRRFAPVLEKAPWLMPRGSYLYKTR